VRRKLEAVVASYPLTVSHPRMVSTSAVADVYQWQESVRIDEESHTNDPSISADAPPHSTG
jgi:hypothetical protein